MTRSIPSIEVVEKAGEAFGRGDTPSAPLARATARHRTTLRHAAPLLVLVLAAACGGSAAERLDARAPEVPFVDQYNPRGKDAYYDGAENCGPALLAGIAKARGQTGGLEDAALINRLAAIAGTDAEGTTGHGMIAALQSLDMRSDANEGGDLTWIEKELAAGHDVIANGDFYAVPGRAQPGLHSGHYIAVTAARDEWTSYDVTDPADRTVTSLTASQLQTFIVSNPQGGFTISAW